MSKNEKGATLRIGIYAIMMSAIWVLLLSVGINCSDRGDETVSVIDADTQLFTFKYADDIKGSPNFDTAHKRKAYRVQALRELNSLFIGLSDQFGFRPDHTIHITLSLTVRGRTNIAYTEKDYTSDGSLVGLSMYFPHAMFSQVAVRAHEMTHAFLAPFLLPTWVDEGMAVYVENQYADVPKHPIFDSLQSDIRVDEDGVNAVQHWTEGRGAYRDLDLTLWCYRYSHTLINYIEESHPDALGELFDQVHPHSQLTTEEFVRMLDGIIHNSDIVKLFHELSFVF